MYPGLKSLSASLSLFVLICGGIVGCIKASKNAGDLDQRESYAYLLTMDRINRMEHAGNALRDWLDNNEEVSKKMENDYSLVEGTFDERARAFETKYPEAATVVRQQGISTREYLLTNHALVQAIQALGTQKVGQLQDYSKSAGDVNPANLRFVEQHQEEIRKSMQYIRIRM